MTNSLFACKHVDVTIKTRLTTRNTHNATKATLWIKKPFDFKNYISSTFVFVFTEPLIHNNKISYGIAFAYLAAGFLTEAKAACDEKRCNPTDKTNALSYLKWFRVAFTTLTDPDRRRLFHTASFQ